MQIIYLLMAVLIGFLIRRYSTPIVKLRAENENLTNKVNRLKLSLEIACKNSYRVGDLVYTNNERFGFNRAYYIHKTYTGLKGQQCAIVHSIKDYKGSSLHEGNAGISCSELSFIPYPTCNCCGKQK